MLTKIVINVEQKARKYHYYNSEAMLIFDIVAFL